jgi:hypothetical protein
VWDGVPAIAVPVEGDVLFLQEGTETLDLTDGAEYTLVFTVIGDSLLCQVASGDELVDEIEGEDDALSGGYVGVIGGENSNTFHWDNVVIETR